MVPHFNETQMTAQPSNSTPSWKCTGPSANPHPEFINNNDKCQYCDKTYKNCCEENQIAIRQRILLFASGIAVILVSYLVTSAIVYAFAQIKNNLQQREQQVIEGSKCVRLIGEINNVVWQGAALNSNAVMLIQQQLRSLGYYKGEVDGIFAKMTRKAVKDFQQNCKATLERQKELIFTN
jgi:hypothetical protein